jgi:hypothetical protein
MLLQLHVNGQDNVQAYAKAIRLQLAAMQAAHRGHDVRSLTLQAHPPYADLVVLVVSSWVIRPRV